MVLNLVVGFYIVALVAIIFIVLSGYYLKKIKSKGHPIFEKEKRREIDQDALAGISVNEEDDTRTEDSEAIEEETLSGETSEIIDGIEINEQFRNALTWLNDTDTCIFITGKAGTGKSTLLKYFVYTSQKQVALLAPTGVAALNIGGVTIHSFFKFPARPITDADIRVARDKKLYQSFDAIVIDEISMVRADMLDAIDRFLRLNGKDRKKPFGGMKMIFFGDLYQLPPIVANSEERQYLASRYQGAFFFQANVLHAIEMKIIELTKVYRQKDAAFIDLLNAIRTNEISQSQLDLLNSRFLPGFNPDSSVHYITLTPTKDLANRINMAKLKEIDAPQYTFRGMIEGQFPDSRLPTEARLILKKDAQVMLVRNDIDGRWVNGTLAKIHKIGHNFIKVAIEENGNTFYHNIDKEKWEIYNYTFDPYENRIKTVITGAFTQYPLKLAWAVTIHKSQGLTFDRMILDIGSGAFAAGQTYVALSRCTSFEGLILRKKIGFRDIRMDPEVKLFMAMQGPERQVPGDT